MVFKDITVAEDSGESQPSTGWSSAEGSQVRASWSPPLFLVMAVVGALIGAMLVAHLTEGDVK
jgi:hypothetical protein